MKSVRYVAEAREELLHEVRYFAAISASLAERFDAAVQKAESFAATFAEAGSPYKHGTRRVYPGRFQFSIVYLVRADEIVIVAIAPFKRRPGYWRSRTAAI